MKELLLLTALACTFFACQGQSATKAKKTAEGIENLRKEYTPGTVSTSATGYYMKCKIDGRDWQAVSMMPLRTASRVLGYAESGSYIGIPGMTPTMKEGFKLVLGKSYNADIYLKGDKTLIDKDGNVILLDKTTGKVEVTKRDGEWIEGTFYFSATSSGNDKRVEVTDGVFRVR